MQYIFAIITLAVIQLCFSWNIPDVDADVGDVCVNDILCESDSQVCDTDNTYTCICNDASGYTDNGGTCELKSCGDLTTPDHGSVDTNAGTKVGHQATFSCDDGYTPSVTATSDCQVDGTWSTTSHTCTLTASGGAVDCGNPTAPAHGSIPTAPAATTDGNEATVECDSGYTMNGTTTISCQYDGSWSTPGTCTAPGGAVDCGNPTAPAHGSIPTAPAATTEGNEATVECDSGYTMDGTDTISCQNDANWSTPGTCSDDAAFLSASLVFTLAFTIATRYLSDTQ